jgi:two-component system OmpR family sensor kinase
MTRNARRARPRGRRRGVRARFRMARLPRTLRSRLIAGLVALLALACASVGLVTYFTVQGTLSNEVNTELQTATSLAYNCWQNEGLSGQSGPGTGGSGNTGTTSTSASYSAAATNPGSSALSGCTGLGEQTFVALISPNGQCVPKLIGDPSFELSVADKSSLLGIAPWKAPAPGKGPGNQRIPATTRYLSWAQGTFLLTAVSNPKGDGSVYITGIPLSSLQDTLRDVALAEAIVFGAVLLLAGGGGTLWVRFALRPLTRVAATASQVAELPLESGEVELPKGVPDTDPGTETGQLGLAFNRMLGHVQNALKRRAASEDRLRRFAADASHELRTPLAAIRGYAELALRPPGVAPAPGTAERVRDRLRGVTRVTPRSRSRTRSAGCCPSRRG